MIGSMKSWWFIKESVWVNELGVAGHMKSKEGKRGVVIFLIEFIIIGCFLCECVCELNEISMKRMRELLVL
jgi:formate hydrogenlyase subunit 6/NADH:ubiquinone oxidoreductase subunit I